MPKGKIVAWVTPKMTKAEMRIGWKYIAELERIRVPEPAVFIFVNGIIKRRRCSRNV